MSRVAIVYSWIVRLWWPCLFAILLALMVRGCARSTRIHHADDGEDEIRISIKGSGCGR